MILRSLAASCALVAVAWSAQPPSNEEAPSTFPAGRGRETMLRVCSACHTPESAVARYQTHEDWKKTLDQMADNGAQATEEEWSDILAYLDKNFSRIFINTATAKELETAMDVTPDVADAIVQRRVEKGEYRSVDDLKDVPGLAAATIDARKDRFIF